MFKKLFKRKNEPVYNIVDVEAKNLGQYWDGINQINRKEIDGFIIRNVLSQDEVNSILENYNQIPKHELNEIVKGLIVFPPPFSLVDQNSENSEEKLNEYYRNNESFYKEFPQRFGVDFVDRCQKVISKIASGREILVPKGENGIGIYHPATIKQLTPGKGELKAHCGNYFHKEFPTFYAHMKSISTIRNQLSYFVMLNPSQKGGELTLYDVLWEQAQIRRTGDTVLEAPDGKLFNLLDTKKVKRDKLKPNPGDMIVFSGGRIWHKVEVAEGTERYTIGGFMSIAKNDESIYIWS